MQSGMGVMVGMALVGLGGSALAEKKTLVVGAGDCKDAALLGVVRDFQDLSRGLLRGDLFEHDDVLNRVRPQPTRSLEDLQRQLETARSLVYNAENERALELTKDALAGLERASPQVGPWPVTVDALMLNAQILKNLDRVKGMNEAFRRIVRVAPQFQADPSAWPPSSIRALDAVRKETQHSKKGLLQVSTLAGSPASVFVDGREVGKTPLRLELPQGTYRLSLLSQDAESFPRVVRLGREEAVTVDLAFEGSLTAQMPLCMSGEDAGAIKLATAVGAGRLVVLRNTAQRHNPPYVSGVLYEVDRGERMRNAGIRPEQLRDLMSYLFTGQPDISNEPPPIAATAQPPEMPPLVEVRRTGTQSFPWRSVGYTAVGIGAAAAIAGVIVFAATPAMHKDANGNVLLEDMGEYRSTQTQQGVGVGFMVGGAAVAGVGAAMAAWAHSRETAVKTSVVPTAGGAVLVLGGEF